MLLFAAMIVIVFLYGLSQYPKARGENHYISERVVQASKQKVWNVISDVGNYHKVTAGGIDDVQIISGSGLGMKRVCSAPNGDSWEETCTVWEPGNRFEFVVNTEREDYPLPFKKLSAVWKVDSISPNKSKIILDMTYEFENPFLAGYFLSIGKKQGDEDAKFLMDNWQRIVESEETTSIN